MFAKGEFVQIKKEFWLYAPTIGLGINEQMRKMQGQVYEIKANPVNGVKTRYRLYTDDGSNWVWDENWLESVSLIKDVYTEELDLLFKGD